jgi:F-type H+-transporting ATPase subunit b
MHYLTLLYNWSVVLLFSEGGEHKGSLLTVNPGLIIWTIIIFVLLLFLLKKIAWKPLLTALHTREQSIKDAIENAEKLKAEAEIMIAENKKAMAQANAESMKVLNEAREAAGKIKDEIVHKANEQAKQILEQSKRDIQTEKESALSELRSEVADLAIKTAEKVIKENLDETKQKKIVNDFLNQIPSNN